MKQFILTLAVCFSCWGINPTYSQENKIGRELIKKGDKFLSEGRYDSAETYYNRVNQFANKNNLESLSAEAVILLGVAKDYQGKYHEAISLLYPGLAKAEKIKDTILMKKAMEDLGIVYDEMGDYKKAMGLYEQSMNLSESLHDSQAVAGSLHNIAGILSKINQTDKALVYLNRAYHINKNTGKLDWLTLNVSLMGTVLSIKKEYQEAIEKFKESLKLSEKINDMYGSCIASINIGENSINIHDYLTSEYYLNKALKLSRSSHSLDFEKETERLLSLLYETKHGNNPALEHYKKYVFIRDSIYNLENEKKEVEERLNYDFNKKELAAKAEQEKKDIRQRNIRYSFTFGLIGILLFLAIVYRQRNKISKERKRSEDLLLNILPEEVAEELKIKGSTEAKLMEDVTVLFTDFKGFTQLSEKLTPKELVAEIDLCFRAFDHIMQKHNVEKIKTIGDAYMAAGGLPIPNNTHAIDVVNAAVEIQQFMQQHKEERQTQGKLFFEIRIGIHTGPVVAGIVGVKKFAYDIWGDTVNTASRMESSGEAGKINISETTYAMVKDKFSCSHRGKISAKGKGEIDMYFIE